MDKWPVQGGPTFLHEDSWDMLQWTLMTLHRMNNGIVELLFKSRSHHSIDKQILSAFHRKWEGIQVTCSAKWHMRIHPSKHPSAFTYMGSGCRGSSIRRRSRPPSSRQLSRSSRGLSRCFQSKERSNLYSVSWICLGALPQRGIQKAS